jgi:hypothetical protein
MAKQTFTTGQVLTAAQMTSLQANDYNWTVSAQTSSFVLIAANAGQHVTMNNAGATTITVNTSLFTAGDTVRITNIGGVSSVCTITAGTATVTTAGSLALTQYASGILYFSTASAAIFFPDAKTSAGQGLTVVKAETAFSAASSVTADSVFTSAYSNYRILITSATAAGAPQMNITLRASGTAATTNYNFQQSIFTGASVTASNTASTTSFVGGLTTTTVSWWMIDLFNPQATAATQMIMSMSQTGSQSWLYWGNNTNATSYDGIGFAPASSTITGSYTIYGYGKTA